MSGVSTVIRHLGQSFLAGCDACPCLAFGITFYILQNGIGPIVFPYCLFFFQYFSDLELTKTKFPSFP